jgi:chemotaxis protein methyltransferase CheR
MRDSEFEFIRTLVYQRSRINLGADKRELVAARLGKRLRAVRLESIGEYCRLLQGPDAEAESARLIDVISTHHTAFFRENSHFEFVRHQLIPEMRARARFERWPALRAWCAACSTGEEPYSLAITLAECLPSPDWPWRIEATDISDRVLDQARGAVYPEAALAGIPPGHRRVHFQEGVGPQAGNFRIKPALRAAVRFQQLNLLAGPAPFPEPFHVIFCRNVMIYFDRQTQEELIARLVPRLVPGGYLLVGHAESLTGLHHSLQAVKPAVYRRPLAS